LFLALGLMSPTALLLADSKLTQAAILAVTVWAFCRLYYFLFYVIEHYVDPSFRFRGLHRPSYLQETTRTGAA
jgi:hypothetical protein